MSEPGSSAAISLYLVTVAFLVHRYSAERAMLLLAIQKLVDDAGDAFAAGQAEYDKRKEAINQASDI